MSRKKDFAKFQEMQKSISSLPVPQTETLTKSYLGRCRKTDVEIDKAMGRYSDEFRKAFL